MNIEQSIRAVMELKERKVRQEGVGADLRAMVEVWRTGERLGTVGLLGRDTPEKMADVDAAIMAFGADGIVHVDETYYEERTRPNTPLQSGELSRRFAAGDPGVLEAIWVSAISPDGHLQFITLPYTYSGRRVLWGDPPTPASAEDGRRLPGTLSADGEITRAILGSFKRSMGASVEMREEALERFRERGLILVGSPVRVSTPRRNAPCPCGSGLKFKQCCLNN